MVQGTSLFWGLFNNLAVFIVLIAVYGYLNGIFNLRRMILRQIVMGLTFGIVAIICMQIKIPVYEGVMVDQRNAIVILGGTFGGPIASLISAIFAGTYRIYLGGAGVWGGCLGILLSAIAGSVIHYNRKRIDTPLKAAVAALGATIFILPGFLFIMDIQTGFLILQKMLIPYGSAVFVGVFFTGLLLETQEHQYSIKNELSVSEKRYRELFESLIDVCIRTDGNGKIIIISPSCKKMFGFSPNEMTGKGIYDYCNDIITWETLRSIIQENRYIDNFEVEIRKKDGSSIWVSINARLFHDEQGNLTGSEAIIRDISQIRKALQEKNQLQENLRQIQKMESIGTLAGGIAHDFNNSLSGIIGGAELLRYEEITDVQRREYIDLILTAADRAGELTRKLLAFSRKGTTVINSLDIIIILSDTVSILRRTIDKKVSINEDFRVESAWVEGDGALLQSAFLNLGINAGHAMPDGGNLTFSLDTVELNSDYCDLSTFEITPGTFIEISISDTGQGIAPEIMPRIFEPFFTTKEQGKGTGLGLAAVYATIRDHNGAITVYSEIGKGTVFHVYLPLSKSQSKQLKSEPVVPHGTGTILLVDDELLVQTTASTILSKLGYDVIVAENGRRGIELYNEHRAEIKLVILDMIMPVMGGRDAFSNIHALDPSLPIIISSGFSRETDHDSLRQQGVSGFLRKPFHRLELAEMIARLLVSSDQKPSA